jgi:hypothetical protein
VARDSCEPLKGGSMIETIRTCFCVALASLLVPASAFSASNDCTIKSGEHTVPLLELYTSEGCSSCPPADRWLSELRNASNVAGKVVPLALHVDYWDYIGWKDSFAQSSFAVRQRRLAESARHAVVYTPQFFVQGKPYDRPSTATVFNAELDAIYRQTPRADLTMSQSTVAAGRVTVNVNARLRDAVNRDPVGVVVVLYENGLITQVSAGENRGSKMDHDFVVREWVGPKPLPAKSNADMAVTISLPTGGQAGNFGLAAFVENLHTQEVLQTISGPLCQLRP